MLKTLIAAMLVVGLLVLNERVGILPVTSLKVEHASSSEEHY